MTFEGIDLEAQERLVLVEALKTKGAEDKETLELLIAWTEKKEQEVERDGTREAQVNFEIARGDLYLDAGLFREAEIAYEDASIIAEQEGLKELVQRIEEKISAI